MGYATSWPVHSRGVGLSTLLAALVRSAHPRHNLCNVFSLLRSISLEVRISYFRKLRKNMFVVILPLVVMFPCSIYLVRYSKQFVLALSILDIKIIDEPSVYWYIRVKSVEDSNRIIT
jgi:hypothetical protein